MFASLEKKTLIDARISSNTTLTTIQQLLKIEGVLKSNSKMCGASRANMIIHIKILIYLVCTAQKRGFEWYLKSGEVSSSSIYILLGPSSRLAYSESILPKQLQLIIQQLLNIANHPCGLPRNFSRGEFRKN